MIKEKESMFTVPMNEILMSKFLKMTEDTLKSHTGQYVFNWLPEILHFEITYLDYKI